jgi:hypothetical protein
MKHSKVLDERIRRVRVLFKELGYKIFGDERSEDSFTAAFDNNEGTQGGFFIDRESRFLEIGYTFSFSSSMSAFLRDRLEEMLKICYEFGCYINIENSKPEISFSLFTKLYFSGLTYFSLKDSLKDFKQCVELTTDLLDIQNEKSKEEEESI